LGNPKTTATVCAQCAGRSLVSAAGYALPIVSTAAPWIVPAARDGWLELVASQSLDYVAEQGGGFLWTPRRSANGRLVAHWESMIQVAVGDRVLNYVDRFVCVVSI
jgi:hypothetical protein